MRSFLLLCAGIVCVNKPVASHRMPFETIYAWKYLDYEWDNASHKAAAVASGGYNYRKPVIIDVDRSRDGRTFVTVIRTDGVPSSLNVIGRQRGPGGPLLRPYPNWQWAERGDCKAITSVYRMMIDRCDRLWVLDNGKIAREMVCPTQLLVFDLDTDKLIKRVKIPDKFAQSSVLKAVRLTAPIVDVLGPNCTNTIVYMGDSAGRELVIYDDDSGEIWRINLFPEDPTVTNHVIPDESSRIQGTTMTALIMTKSQRAPILYYRPTFSHNIYSATTIDLRNRGRGVHHHTIRNIAPNQMSTVAVSSNDILFFGLPMKASVACWNTCKPFNKDNLSIIARDRDRLRFVSSMKIIPSDDAGTKEEIWTVSNSVQKVMAGAINFTEVNFRVMKADVARLTTGTSCALP